MYYTFNYYKEVTQFLETNPTARLVSWPYGRYGSYRIFVPVEQTRGQQ